MQLNLVFSWSRMTMTKITKFVMPKLFKIPYNLLCEKCQKSRYFCGRILARISRSRKVSEVFHVCMSVDSKLQFTHASSSSHSWLSMQPQQVQSSKLMVTSLSCAELGTAQLQLVKKFFQKIAASTACMLATFSMSVHIFFIIFLLIIDD